MSKGYGFTNEQASCWNSQDGFFKSLNVTKELCFYVFLFFFTLVDRSTYHVESFQPFSSGHTPKHTKNMIRVLCERGKQSNLCKKKLLK